MRRLLFANIGGHSCAKIAAPIQARRPCMPYDLDRFASDCRTILGNDPGPAGREEVRRRLETLLAEPQFVARYCQEAAPGVTVLYEDTTLGFQILAHVNAKPHASPPHDHGASWAIYGQATEYTDMIEWERLDDGRDATSSKLKPTRTYRLTPGHAGIYQEGMIHSIDYPAKASFIRVTGTNLDRIPRSKFDLDTGKATAMEPRRPS
jgi:hypothetical protein